MDYVVGLPFSSRRDRLLLIRKARPTWQAGLLNGIGGKLESGETARQAMHRESEEEAGLATDWRDLAVLQGEGFRIDFFTAFDDAILDCEARTDEPLVLVPVPFPPQTQHAMVPNLALMIALALDQSGIAKPVFMRDVAPPRDLLASSASLRRSDMQTTL